MIHQKQVLGKSLFEILASAQLKAEAEGHRDVANRHIAMQKSLREFLAEYRGGVDDIPGLEMLTEKFATECRDYLNSHSAKRMEKVKAGKSHTNRHLTNLRAIIRDEIKNGILPNIKVLAEADANSQIEIKLKQPRVSHEFAKIVGEFENAARRVEDTKSMTNTSEMVIARHKMRHLGFLILGVLLCGIGIEAVTAITEDDIDNKNLHIKHLGLDITMPDAVENLLNKHLPLLRKLIKSADYQRRMSAINDSIGKLLSRMDIDPERWLGNTTACWLQLALEHRGTPTAVRRIIAARVGHCEVDADALREIITAAATTFKTDVKNWYVVRGIGANGSRDKLSRLIRKADFDPAVVDTTDVVLLDDAHLFYPEDLIIKVSKGKRKYINNPVLDRLIFIRCTLMDAKKIQRQMGRNGVILGFRSGNAKTFAVVPDKDFYSFKNFLAGSGGDFVAFDPAKSYVGRRVLVTGGRFAGCEGEIVELKVAATPDAPQKVVKYFTVILDQLQRFGTIRFDSRHIKEL